MGPFDGVLRSERALVVNAERVVYSTCSLFEEENEQVVEHVLEQMGDDWELHEVLPSWKHRGLSTYKVGPLCIRASPAEDQTNGFFVARFHRKRNPLSITSPNKTDGEDPDTQEEVPFYLVGKKRSRPEPESEQEDKEAVPDKPKAPILTKSERRKRKKEALRAARSVPDTSE